jgi:Photosynthetic reaction centre cytochrome C subunit
LKGTLKNNYKERFLPTVRLRLAILTLALMAIAFAVFAQPAPQGRPYSPMPKPSNLKVLPKDISISDLTTLMQQYNDQLGVECGYCHVAVPGTRRLDFVSDAKPEKATARIMMTMTDELNSKYIGNLPTGSDMKVTCGTCHRGHAMPEEFVPAAGPPAKP